MARTSTFSMKWWWGPLCTRPTRWVGWKKATTCVVYAEYPSYLEINLERGAILEW